MFKVMVKRNIGIVLFLLLGFQSFGQNYTLEQCKELALENNLSLKDSKLKIDAADKVKKSAYTNYFPKVSASASLFKSSKGLLDIETPEMNLPVYNGNPENLANPTQFAYIPPFSIETLDYINTATLTAIQPIYAGGRIKKGNQLATLNQDVQQLQHDLNASEITVKTEEYYWNLVALNQKMITIENYQTLLQNLHKEINDFFEAGLTKKSDVLKVKLELNKIEGSKLELNNGIDILKMAFAQHLGLEDYENLSVKDSIVKINAPDVYYKNPEEAVKIRKEAFLLEKAVDAEVLQKRLTNGELLPELGVGVGGLYLDITDNDNFYGVVFASLTIPISDWWSGSYKKQEHNLKIEIAKNNQKEQSQLMQIQISKEYKALTESYKQIEIAKTSLIQSTEYLQELENSYDAGLTSLSDLLEAKAINQEANDALIDAKAKYKINIAKYKNVIGNY
ncbi:MAG: TolC family protein [Flavobacteriaceae bacterium]|nr:TolC family protein [Flavobacteriaceae bacterium]